MVTFERTGDTLTATLLPGSALTLETSLAVEKCMVAELDRGPCQQLILDMSGVEYLDSAFLSKLLTIDKRMRAAGGKLLIRNLSPLMEQMLKATRLDALFTVEK